MKEFDYKKILGINIKQIRNSLNMTQEEFCNAINLEISNLSNIENGKSFPSMQTLIQIITVFKIEPNRLYNIDFYNDPEIINKLMLDYFNRLSLSKKRMILKMIMLVCEENKNSD